MTFILTGDKQSGKSTALQKWVEGQSNIKGFITLDDKDGIRHIYDLKTRISTPYAIKTYAHNAIPIGKWFIYNNGLKVGIEMISNFDLETQDVLIIDEIGSLELQGEGYAKVFQRLLERSRQLNSHVTLFIVVRTELLNQVISYFDLKNYKIIKKEELYSILY